MKIEWNKVTRFSQIIAIVLFVGVFALGYWLGTLHQSVATDDVAHTIGNVSVPPAERILSDTTFNCANEKTVRAIFRQESVELLLSDGRHFALPHAVSGSGARYANQDESIVFWEKGPTAFMTEGSTTTYADCSQTPLPQ